MSENTASGLLVRLKQNAPIPLDAEFACPPGEVLALVGPSGSGKSTILRCIAGLSSPPAGFVGVGDRVFFDTASGIDLEPQSRAVGIVFQHYALFPHMTAHANIAAALGHVSPAERPNRVSELLDLVGLEGLSARRPDKLSGGQQQRVALARALARDPSVLLLDEPFSSVDQVTRGKLHRELVHLRQRLSSPVVLVTHDLNEAATLADRMSILHHGKTLQTGPPLEVMSKPDNALIARLVGLRNVFEGVIASKEPGGRAYIEWRGLRLEVNYSGPFEEGQRVGWVIPSSGVILHRRNRPSAGERENPVHGVISETLRLGETVNVVMRTEGRDEAPLWFSVPTHTAARNALVEGGAISVSLKADSIHLMTFEARDGTPPAIG